MPIHRRTAALLAVAFAATALAGCFTPSADAEDHTFHISRSFVINMDADKAEALEAAESPDEFVRALVDASLVVRASEAGAYTLAYTDDTGSAQTKTLVLAPGAPQAVEGVDAFTAASLTRGDSVVASRGPISHAWWQIGDVPLGVRSDAPAEADYLYRSFASLDVTLNDIQAEEGDARLDSLLARLSLPATGSLTWTLTDEGAEDRLDLRGSFAIDDSRGSLALVDAKGTIEGEAAEAGVEVLSGGASVDAAVSMWLENGRIKAGQFQGSNVRADPKIVMWATGAMAEGGEMPCAGKTRADACEPEEMESVSESEPAGTRESVDEDEFAVDDEDGREALAFLQKLFAQDLGLHDSLTIRATVDSDDLGESEGTSFRASYVHELTVAARETVQVPAGEFDAYSIVQTSAVDVDVDAISEETCATYGEYGCQEYETQRILDAYNLQETLIRSTLWLDAATFQPLKGTVEAPADVGAILRDLIGSFGEGAWAGSDIQSFDPTKLQLTADSEASFEARKLAGNTTLSPYVGLVLGGMMSGTLPSMISPMFGSAPFAQQPEHYSEPVYPESPPRFLSLYQETPVDADGSATLRITSASPEFYWSDMRLVLDDADRYMAFGGDCTSGSAEEYVACDDAGEPQMYRDTIDGGDTILLPYAEPGQLLRVIDASNGQEILVVMIE